MVNAWENEEVDAEIVVDEFPLQQGHYAVNVQVLNENPELGDIFETGVRIQLSSVGVK